jgi:hypothetical protein
MSPVALPTVGPQSDESDGGQESALRAGAQMSAEGDGDAERERPL